MQLDPNGTCKDPPESHFWAAVHDLICHPLLILTFYSSWSVKFHDWTSWKAWPDNKFKNRSERNG